MAHKNWKKTAVCIGVLAVIGGWGHSATAQGTTQAKNNSPELEEIIVSARKVEERLQDAPVAVSAMSGDTLEERGIRDLGEMTKLASSVKFDSDGDVRAGVSIRGVGGSADTNVSPGVGLFVDGVYQPSSAYFTVPFFDVERMEVLKGPQGTLYGKNTMGGAINIISRQPTKELGGALMLEGASGNQQVANGVINLPITSDLGNRTAIFYRKTDGLQDNQTTGEDASWRDDFAARTHFVYDADNGFNSALSLFYADLTSAPFAYSETTRGLNHPIDNVTKNLNGEVDSEYQSANWTNSFDFDVVTVTSLTAYDKGDVDTLIDADYTVSPTLTAGGVSDRDTFAQELRFEDSNANSDFHWLLGGYYSDDDLKSTSNTTANLGAFFGGIRPLQTAEKHETGETYAGFGQLTWTLDDFEFVAGLRYDKEERKNHTTSLDGTPAVLFNPLRGVVNYRLTEVHREVVSEEWQPKVSVSYHFTPDIMSYGVVSRGFRAGGFNGLTAPPEVDTYQPEITTNYEAGIKSELFDRRLRLNGSVFYTDYTDIIQTDIVIGTTGQATVFSRNGGEATSQGFELDAAYKVTQDLTVSGGYTYLDIENEEIPTGAIRKQVSGFAKNVFNVQADYLYPFGDDMAFGAHISANYIGETPMATEPDYREASTVVDASLDFIYQDITLSVFGKNVFDEQYYNSYIPAAQTIAKTSSIGVLNQPALYGVRLSTTF